MTSQRFSRLRRASVRAASSSSCPSPLRSVSDAVLRSVLGAVLLAPAVLSTLPGQAHAQSVGESRSYSIPAGPLDKALTAFAASSGVMLSFEPAQVQGLQTGGLQGEHTVWGGFSLLLQGTGLEAQSRGPGSYVLRKASAQGSATDGAAGALPGVTVRSRRSAETEGTGSYASTGPTTTSTRIGLTARETPQSITVVTRQMIEDKGLTTVEQVLQHTPGVSMVGDASQNSQIFVRGFYLESGIQIDGVNTTSAQPIYEGSISQGMDPAIADRVEVIKGATGIVGGLGSPSATVNYVRKRPTQEFQASAEVGVGSWNRMNGEADISGAVNEAGTVRGRVVAAVRHGDSYMDRYGYDKAVFYGVVDVDVAPATVLSLAIDHQRSDTDGAFNWNSNPAFYTDGGVFRPSVSFSTGQDWTYWNVRQTSFTPTLEHRFDNGWQAKLTLRHAKGTIDRVSFYPGDYVDRATGNLVLPTWNSTGVYADRSLRHSDTDSVDAYASGRFEWLGRQHDLAFGASYAKNDFTMATYNSAAMAPYAVGDGAVAAPAISGTSVYDNAYSQEQAGVFVTARFNPIDPLKLMVGGRLSTWKYVTEDRKAGTSDPAKHDNIFTPYLGVVYDLNKTVAAYASYTSVFRAVTRYGADGQLLAPVEGSNAEIGLKFGLLDDKLNLTVAAYQSKENNYPEYANAGQLPSGEWIYKSLDNVKTTGYEVELSGRLAPGWEVSGGYTYNKAVDSEGKPKLTYVPKDLLKISLTHKMAEGLTLGGGVRYQSGTYYETGIYAVSPSIPVVQEQGGYSLLDLMARWQFNPTYAVTLNLNNAFDKVYNRSMWGYADYGEPRNVMLSLRAKW